MNILERERAEKIRISWDDFIISLKKLANQIPKNMHVWGPPRNGTIIAAMLCHQRPDLKLIVTDSILMEYDKNIVVYDTDELIICDDICDSGNTLRGYVKEGYETACVFYRIGGSDLKIDYIGNDVGHNHYLVFPWEL